MSAAPSTEPLRFEHYRVSTDADGRPVKLGEGAMGVTYLAEDTNLRVKVALKVIHPSLLGDPEIAQRFQREAQAAARLRHPNVAAVYHLGTMDDTFFYAMEFVEGETLKERVQRDGPLPVKQALEVTLQICEALNAAARHHMVHRDIKPANIMLEGGDEGVLHTKLIDFGLAKPLQAGAQDMMTLQTQQGLFLGTPVFASPEQVQDAPLDSRSDLYALGLTLWFMLEGRPPFEGSLHKVLYDQVHSPPPVERLMWVPGEVRALLGSLLEKRPEARPQSARELRQKIHDCLRALAGSGTSLTEWQQRFKVADQPQVKPWGVFYEGVDSMSGAVSLNLLHQDRFSDPEAVLRVVADARRAIEIHHPNVLRHLTVFPTNDPNGTGWMVVTEQPGSQSLLDVLRRVKQFPAAEAMPLFVCLASATDACLSFDMLDVDLDPARIHLKTVSSHATTAGADGQTPVEVMPKLSPINYAALAAFRHSDETAVGLTQVLPQREARSASTVVQRLALLAYQCLGGSASGASSRSQRYIPLPGLTQKQNEILRQAILEKPYTSAMEFMADLQQLPREAARSSPQTISAADATVTLSPWERLAAVASAQGTVTSGTVAAPQEVTAAASVSTKTEVPSAEAPPSVEAAGGEKSTSRSKMVEIPVAGGSGTTTKTSAHNLRETLVHEWQDAKPAIEKLTAPVRQSVRKIPRWAFITIGCVLAAFGAVLYEIANRPVPTIPVKPEPVTGVGDLKGKEMAKAGTTTTAPPVIPVTPPPPPSLDDLLQAATDAAKRGDAAKLAQSWAEIQKRFSAKPSWTSHATKAPAFIAALIAAYRADKLGDPAAAARDYKPVFEAGARDDDVELLAKLCADLKADAAAAQSFELALLDALAGSPAKGERLLDESLRLAQLRHQGPVAARARDLIRQKLDPLIDYRERKPRPDDVDAALRSGLQALSPKLELLAATGEPGALYLLGDKLRQEGRAAEAISAFEKAAQTEASPATNKARVASMLQLGLILSNAPDKAASAPRAVFWFKEAERQGSPQAGFLLGECYLDGKGTARDYDLALKHLDAAAAKDIAEAHYLLGTTYLGLMPAETGGEPLEPGKLNPALTGDARLAKARVHLEAAVKRGMDAAAGVLAGLLIQGQGGPADIARGVQMLDTATKLANPDPNHLRNLAYLLMPQLLEGLPPTVTPESLRAANVKPDLKRVEQLMSRAAKLGDVVSQEWCRENRVTY